MKYLKLSLGFLISAVCVWVVFRGFSFSYLKDAMSSANYIWFLPAIFIFFFNHFLRSFRWRILLSPIKWISSVELFPILITGFFLNSVLPARAGEVARAYAGERRTGVPFSSMLGSVAAERLMDMVGLLAVMLYALTRFPPNILPVKTIFITISVGSIGVGIALYIGYPFMLKLANTTSGFLGKTIRFFVNLIEGFISLKSPAKMLLILIPTLVIWFGEAFSVYCLMRAVIPAAQYSEAASTLVGTCIGYMIPGAPGAIGTMEYFGKKTLVLLGFPDMTAISFIVLLHFFQLVMIVIVGIPCLLKVGLNKKGGEEKTL